METLTAAAMVRMDSPRRRRARIAAAVLCHGEGQIEDEGALGVLAGRDALQDLDADAALEQVVEDDQPFQEAAAEAVDLLDAEHVAVADVGKCVQQVGAVVGGEPAAGPLLVDLPTDGAEGVVLPLGVLPVGAARTSPMSAIPGLPFPVHQTCCAVDEHYWKTNGKMNGGKRRGGLSGPVAVRVR